MDRSDPETHQPSTRTPCRPVRSFSTLARLRILAGLTQEQLAELAAGDFTADTVSKWERGLRRPKLAHAIAVADVLDCDVRLVFPEISGRDEPVELRCPHCQALRIESTAAR